MDWESLGCWFNSQMLRLWAWSPGRWHLGGGRSMFLYLALFLLSLWKKLITFFFFLKKRLEKQRNPHLGHSTETARQQNRDSATAMRSDATLSRRTAGGVGHALAGPRRSCTTTLPRLCQGGQEWRLSFLKAISDGRPRVQLLQERIWHTGGTDQWRNW